jgi:hypothetical protein
MSEAPKGLTRAATTSVIAASFARGAEPWVRTAWTAHLADDVIGIGSDPDEWWEGRSVFAQVVTAQMQEISSAGGRLTAGMPRIMEHGGVVWAVDAPILRLGDETETSMRVTLVAVSDADTLRIRHCHFSVGAANEQVFGQELTTE